jgi:hypothetical protein
MRAVAQWEGELERWFAPFVAGVGRLFLPKACADDPARCRRAGVTRPDEVDRVRAAGVTFGCVLADAGYAMLAAFRQALSARGPSRVSGRPTNDHPPSAVTRSKVPVPPAGRRRRAGARAGTRARQGPLHTRR